MTNLREAIDNHRGNARRALEYAAITKSVVDSARQPGFSESSWNPLRELIAVDEFVRVGNFKEIMRWDEYVAFLTGWAANAEWECTFKRITESDGLVFLELEEHSVVGEFDSMVNSLSVYEFGDTGKITHIDVYLQMALPSADMLKSYDGVEISE
ncbi:hypothetical protein M1247_13130 [Mycobacterium sp. 21AC1]|uniref:hypothetical protein n=1 Tax=[Mycobacterium] appelbergii TaxID=2939269 RepID=UPI0029391453|nr:hypothetical protein [Mycobacterium sp. 21AC1]MDV3125865.1 hypothetical protein [Mycobacterium sp. 21AC1]